MQSQVKTLLIGINSKYIHPSMGIFQLYTNALYETKYKEFSIKDDINHIINEINSSDSDIIGLSVYIWNIEIIKQILPKINKDTFLGGPEASFNTSLLYEYLNVKYIIKGEGEEAFNELIEYIMGKRTIESVSNLYYLNNFGNIKYTFNKLPNLNNVKHDLSLIKDFKNRICYIESSRGCYFNCSYCLASTEKPVRFFPLEEVKNNILYLLNNNARIIKFLDRSFNVNKVYTKEILSFIKEHDNGISTFQFEVVGDNIDDEIVEIINSLRPKMIRFEIGIQTTNPTVTKEIRRIQDFDKLRENILKIKDNVVIHTDLIAGLPLETFESFRKSFNDTFMLFTEELQLGFLKELKGTHISLTKEKYNYIFSDTSPFEVISNKDISSDELKIIKYVEEGVDHFYNKGEFKNLMNYLFRELELNPFDTFYNFIKDMTKEYSLSHYQFPDLTNLLYRSIAKLVTDKEKLFYIIKKDYLTRTKIKPKIFWTSTITREERLIVYKMLSEKENIDINELYNYAYLDKYIDIHNKVTYFIINYKTHKTYELEL